MILMFTRCLYAYFGDSTSLPMQFLVLSTIAYALYEVLYKRLATVKDDPAQVQNSLRILGLMGVHTLLWMW